MKQSALRASYAGMAGVMLGLVLGFHPLTQLLLGLALFALAFAVLAVRAR